jgi:hypothetical protein
MLSAYGNNWHRGEVSGLAVFYFSWQRESNENGYIRENDGQGYGTVSLQVICRV